MRSTRPIFRAGQGDLGRRRSTADRGTHDRSQSSRWQRLWCSRAAGAESSRASGELPARQFSGDLRCGATTS
jgi:hypothetical protein